jgi:hypothetical protein
MRLVKQTLNAQFKGHPELEVERWTLSVGCFLAQLR